MDNLSAAKTDLIEAFTMFQDTSDTVKMLRFRRKIYKLLKVSNEDNAQLLDMAKVIDLWMEEVEYNEFIYSFRIALPVAERLAGKESLDFCDIIIGVSVVGYEKDFKATYSFGKKILSLLEAYKLHPRYTELKLNTGMHVLLRLLRAKYFELNPAQFDENIHELTTMFNEFMDRVLKICGDDKAYQDYKVVAHIRKALFDKNYLAVDDGLSLISENGNFLMYKAIVKEVNDFNAAAGIDKTKTMLNLQIGTNIREIRKSNFLRIDDCAKMLSMTPSVLQSIEQGKRSAHIYYLYKLSETFGIPLDNIVKCKSINASNYTKETLPAEIQKLVDLCMTLEVSDIEALETLAMQLAKKI